MIPLNNGKGDLIAVFDIDSDQPNAFDAQDAAELSAILQRIFGGL